MEKLNYKHLFYFKSKLEEMEEKITQDIHQHAKNHYQEKISEELESIAHDLDEDVFLAEQKKRYEMIKQIKFALLRIKNGVYGVCAKTGKLIDIKRLEANPTSLYNTKYQSEYEKNFT